MEYGPVVAPVVSDDLVLLACCEDCFLYQLCDEGKKVIYIVMIMNNVFPSSPFKRRAQESSFDSCNITNEAKTGRNFIHSSLSALSREPGTHLGVSPFRRCPNLEAER